MGYGAYSVDDQKPALPQVPAVFRVLYCGLLYKSFSLRSEYILLLMIKNLDYRKDYG